jgi:uncharacterized DUF497 family protein
MTSAAVANSAKHGISFEVAKEFVGDPLLTIHGDHAHSLEEDRYSVFGATAAGIILFIIVCTSEEVNNALRTLIHENRIRIS